MTKFENIMKKIEERGQMARIHSIFNNQQAIHLACNKEAALQVNDPFAIAIANYDIQKFIQQEKRTGTKDKYKTVKACC